MNSQQFWRIKRLEKLLKIHYRNIYDMRTREVYADDRTFEKYLPICGMTKIPISRSI